MNLTLVHDNRLPKKSLSLPDEYIERMADFYCSDAALKIFPYLHDIPFERWLYHQYALKFEGSDDSCVKMKI